MTVKSKDTLDMNAPCACLFCGNPPTVETYTTRPEAILVTNVPPVGWLVGCNKNKECPMHLQAFAASSKEEAASLWNEMWIGVLKNGEESGVLNDGDSAGTKGIVIPMEREDQGGCLSVTAIVKIPVGKFCDTVPAPGMRIVCSWLGSEVCQCDNHREILECESGLFVKCQQCLDTSEISKEGEK